MKKIFLMLGLFYGVSLSAQTSIDTNEELNSIQELNQVSDFETILKDYHQARDIYSTITLVGVSVGVASLISNGLFQELYRDKVLKLPPAIVGYFVSLSGLTISSIVAVVSAFFWIDNSHKYEKALQMHLEYLAARMQQPTSTEF